jgi:hypothetical protein
MVWHWIKQVWEELREIKHLLHKLLKRENCKPDDGIIIFGTPVEKGEDNT